MQDDVNHYDLQLQNGQTVQVQTDRHHDQHDSNSWQQHMLDVGKQVVANIATIGIGKIIFKGRGPKR